MIRFVELWDWWCALWAEPRCICRDVEVTEVRLRNEVLEHCPRCGIG